MRLQIAAFAFAGVLATGAAWADTTRIGPWIIYTDKDPIDDTKRGIAALTDFDFNWTLMVRCLDHQIGVMVRKYGQEDKLEGQTLHYDAYFRPDGATVTKLPAQTYSQGGLIIIDALPILDRLESGRDLIFRFSGTDSKDQVDVEFKAYDTKAALVPIRALCDMPGG